MKKTAENRPVIAELSEALELLTEKARDGNVQAMKALLDWHKNAESEPLADDEWSAIYGEGSNVTPLRRSS